MTDAVRELKSASKLIVGHLAMNDMLVGDAELRGLAKRVRAAISALESQAAIEVCKWTPVRDSWGDWWYNSTCGGGSHEIDDPAGQVISTSKTVCPDCGRKIEVCHE
jgi:hypothetical protein